MFAHKLITYRGSKPNPPPAGRHRHGGTRRWHAGGAAALTMRFPNKIATGIQEWSTSRNLPGPVAFPVAFGKPRPPRIW